MEIRFHLVVFQTTTDTMASESVLKNNGIKHAVMPAPQAITASCGLAIRFSPELSGQVKALLTDKLGEGRFQTYAAVRENGQTTYVKSE